MPGEEAAHGTATSLPPARIVVVVQVVSATAFSLRAIKADGKTWATTLNNNTPLATHPSPFARKHTA